MVSTDKKRHPRAGFNTATIEYAVEVSSINSVRAIIRQAGNNAELRRDCGTQDADFPVLKYRILKARLMNLTLQSGLPRLSGKLRVHHLVPFIHRF